MPGPKQIPGQHNIGPSCGYCGCGPATGFVVRMEVVRPRSHEVNAFRHKRVQSFYQLGQARPQTTVRHPQAMYVCRFYTQAAQGGCLFLFSQFSKRSRICVRVRVFAIRHRNHFDPDPTSAHRSNQSTRGQSFIVRMRCNQYKGAANRVPIWQTSQAGLPFTLHHNRHNHGSDVPVSLVYLRERPPNSPSGNFPSQSNRKSRATLLLDRSAESAETKISWTAEIFCRKDDANCNPGRSLPLTKAAFGDR